jgi:hypothetical protein
MGRAPGPVLPERVPGHPEPPELRAKGLAVPVPEPSFALESWLAEQLAESWRGKVQACRIPAGWFVGQELVPGWPQA